MTKPPLARHTVASPFGCNAPLVMLMTPNPLRSMARCQWWLVVKCSHCGRVDSATPVINVESEP